ncbi:TMV resistance protein N isoform X2 [Malus domestica]|uniref:TMV resistance protein N isoform X2 n=1 Tax=Malus domestica TaxID=3750 RepID=UPI003976D9CD
MIPQAGVSSSSSPTPLWTYDVFLSFRGTDTRTSFTDHLYAALTRKGIITFRDDEKLKKGSSIWELYNAVEESRCVIAILSSNYADSTWCMEELAKAVECRRVMGQILVPVFYHVHRSELRNQTGNFGKAFCKLEERAVKGNLEKVQRWRAALVEVADLSGFHLQDGFESELIQTIVENISTKLNQTISSVFTDLVGMDSRVKEMLSYLEMGWNNVRIIGIWGMGGIGKTTIAHVVSERIRAQFEAYSFLANVREGTTSVQGVFLNFEKEKEIKLRVNDPFSEMKKLKYLKIWNGNFSVNTKYLSNELALLEWHECPLNSLPSGFESDKLVELKMNSSCIKQLWTGEKRWSRLTFIDMSDSQYLIKTPDFTEVPNLEILVLQGCARLVEVHPTIGGLRNLISLNMRNCKSVESLPPFKSLKSLKTLTLSACSRLKKFPEVEGNMKCLLRVYLDETAIEELPTSIQHLTSLTLLSLRDCKNFLSLPNTIQYLTSLKSLILAGCSKFDEIPENLNCVECLEELDISGTAIRESPSVVGMLNLKYLSFRGCRDLPSNSWHSLFNCWWCSKSYVPTSLLLLTSISSLTSLTELDLSYCNLIDGAIPQDFGHLISLRKLNLSGNNFVRLPESICQLSKLESLNLSNCRRLQLLPELPLSVRHVNAEDCISLMCFQDEFKLWTSAVSGMTTVNSHSSSNNPEYYTSAPRRISRTYTSGGFGMTTFSILSEDQEWKPCVDSWLPTQVFQRDLLDCRSYSMSSVCAQIEIPEWFSNIVTGDSIAIPIPPNLKDNKKWMGVAAVFLVKGRPSVSNSESDTEASDYLYRFTLGTHEFRLEPYLLDWKESCTFVRSSSDDFLCFFYESHMRFPKTLNESSSMWALLEAINPCMEVQKCGIRLVYKQDTAGFIQTFMLCFGGGQHEMNLQEVEKATFESGWFNLDNKYIFR